MKKKKDTDTKWDDKDETEEASCLKGGRSVLQ